MAKTKCCVPDPFDCPNLCDQIDSNAAQTTADCIVAAGSVKEEAIKLLICDVTPPNSFSCSELNVDTGKLTPTQLDQIQNVSNCPTGDNLGSFTGSDGLVQAHRGPDYFTLDCNNKHGNNARFTSVARIVPAILAGRHWINSRIPGSYSFGDLVEADGVTPVPGTTTLALALAAFGTEIDDWLTGKMYSLSDTGARPMSGGTGWGFLSSIITINGFTGWHPINRNEANDIANDDFNRLLSFPLLQLPFNITADISTSTESVFGTSWRLDINGLINDIFGFLGNSSRSIYVRNNTSDS